MTKDFETMSKEELLKTARQLHARLSAQDGLEQCGQKAPSYLPNRDSLFQLMTESSSDMITRHSASNTVLYVSPAIRWLLGHTPDEAIGRPANELIHPEDREAMRASVENALKQGVNEFSVENRMLRKDGSQIWTETRGVIFLGVTGEILEIHCSVRNIDDRKKAEEKVMVMTSAIENMGLPVYWMNREGRFQYVNQAACDTLGYTREEFSQMRLWEIDPDFSEQRWYEARGLLEKERHQRFETRHKTKDGRAFPVEIISDYSVVDGNGIHWAFAREISREKSAEEAVRQMELRLRQAEKMEAIGLLAGGIAHDFNNQLAGMHGYADLLSEEITDPTLLEYINSIILGIKRASGLTEQLLAFSRRGKYLSIPVNMNVIVKEVSSILCHSIDKKIAIRKHLCRGEAVTMGDPSQLQNAVLN